MKDRRFIELVNLYVDRQITSAETAELEAEMQASPARRAIYHQYCQMQKATTVVYESFRSDAPAHEAGATPNLAPIARFEGRKSARRPQWAYYAGGLAAACAAFVFIQMNAGRTAEVPVAVTAPKVAPVAVVAVQPAPARPAAEPSTGLVSLRNNLATAQDYAAMVAALRQEEQRAYANSQAQPVRVQSLFEDGVFDPQNVTVVTGQRTFRGKQAPVQQAEFTAFQFQR